MKKKFIFLMSALAVLTVTAFAAFVNKSAANEIVYDFSVFDAETDTPTSDNWTCATGSWGSVRSAGAMEQQPINERLAGVLFTCTGSGNVIWQLYEGDGYGNQVVANSSTVSITLPEASVGDEIVFYASANNNIEFAGQEIAKSAEYADYTLVAESDAPTISLPKNLMIRKITIKKVPADVNKVWDITTITAADMEGYVDGEGNLTGTYSDDPNAWAALKNNAAFEGELMKNATEAFGPTKGLKFKADGSNWLYVRFYPEEYGGWQLYSNNKDLQITIPAAEGKVIYLRAFNDDGSAITVVSGAKEESVSLGKSYEEVTINATADDVVLKLPKKTFIQKIEVADASDGVTWDVTTITGADMEGYVDGEGNLTGTYSDDPNAWAALKNNAAFEGELMKNATEAFGPTKGLKFKAGGSNWVYVRFYPEDYGGFHICSNNKDLEANIPAADGKVVILKVGGNGGTITTLAGATEESITSTKSYEYYMLHATADVVSLKLFKNCYIQKIYVGDAPRQADPALVIANPEIEIESGETVAIEYTTKNEIAPTFTSSDESVAKVDAAGNITAVAPGTAVITVAQAENPYFTAASKEVAVTVKTAGVTVIEQLVAEAVAGAQDGAATVELAEGGEYTLDAEAAAGFVNLTIEGNGAKIVVGEAGTISAKQGLTIKNVNIDMAAATKPLIILSAMDLENEADAALYNVHGENGKNSFFNEQAITLEKVSTSGMTTALVQTGGAWCLKNLNIKNSIFQLNATSGKFLDWQTNGGDGMIKNINLEGNTIYNLQENDNMFFLAYNTNAPMPEKFYGADDNTCTWTMTNNTFAQCFKQMSDRYTANKVATVKWLKNIWYSHTNLTKTRNCTFEMTETDNSGFGADLGSFGTVEDTQIFVPTEAYDFNEEALVPCFSLFKRTLAYVNRMGDTRWLVEGKVAEGRVWDFSANATNYPEEWATIVADEVNWLVSKPNQRYQNNVALEGTEAVVNVTVPATEEGGEATVETRKISFMEGLVWTADVKKLLIGNGDDNYNCLQIQKGAKFTVSGIYAGDVIAVTACSTAKNAVADNIRFVNAYPELAEAAKAGEYTEITVTAINDGEVTIEAAKDFRLQKLEIRPMTEDYSYPGLAIRLANDIAKDETIVNPEDGSTTVKEFNTKGVRKHAGDKDAIVPTTKNAMVPVTYTSSDESVITVDAEGNFEAIAPGVATITVEQAEGAGFFGATVKRFIVVNPDLAFHTAAINMESEKAELLYTPDALGYVAGADNNGINDYHILPTYASWMFYNNGNDGDGYVQAKNGNNSWMKVDYRDGANDAVCDEACPNSEVTGLNACYRPSVSGGFDLTMDYWVTGISAVKFYYCTSASTEGGLRLNVYEENTEGEPVATLAGVSDKKGKAQNGFSFTVQIDDLDPAKNYIVRALREGEGDVLVYASKFYTENTATGIAEVAVPGRFVDGVIYDLQGRKVTNMQKGSIYLLNGKKFMSK